MLHLKSWTFFPSTVRKLKNFFSHSPNSQNTAIAAAVWCQQIEQETFSRACHHHLHHLIQAIYTWCKSMNSRLESKCFPTTTRITSWMNITARTHSDTSPSSYDVCSSRLSHLTDSASHLMKLVFSAVLVTTILSPPFFFIYACERCIVLNSKFISGSAKKQLTIKYLCANSNRIRRRLGLSFSTF